MANRALVYTIYPNEKQNIQCQKTFGCCRFVYNQMLDVQKERHENGEKHLSKTKANTYCNQHLKKKYPFLKEVDKFALTNAIYHLEDGYDRFFKHLSRFPKYKCKHKAKRSYTTNITNGNIEISDNSIKLPKLGWVKAKIHHRPKEDWKLKSATVTQNRDDSYQVSILFAYEESISPAVVTKETTIGLDYKSDGLYVSSEGDTCGMPHYFRQSADKLAKAQRKLRHKTIGSKNYNKQQKRTAKIHRHIANQRKDFLQKKSTEIANYKLRDRGGQLIKVGRFFPSSQLCSHCGFKNPLVKNLSIRHWDCPNCGTTGIDRDVNAAKNIKKEGIRLLTA
ncbi:MAG: RNA-guided endonuclease TnpB family protein [Anaerobutyricum soehngenii]